MRNSTLIRNMVMTIMAGLVLLAGAAAATAQEKIGGIVEFDKTVHNFGDVMLSDGPLKCTFTMKNISGKPVVIFNVVTSCGCTDVEWTREPVMPGETGTISAVYTNDEGPYPFDKALTAYISDVGKPVILRIRGIAHEKKLSLQELYPVRLNEIGIKDLDLRCGNIEQGSSRSDKAVIANLSSGPAALSFKGVSRGLSIEVNPNPVPAGSTAELRYTVSAMADIWGRNLYHATPVVNGRPATGELSVYAFTTDRFSDLTPAMRAEGSRPIFTTNTYSVGKIKAGTEAKAEFSFSNVGKNDFTIHKIDFDWPAAEAVLPGDTGAGYRGSIKISVDTSGMPSGEMLVTATLTTNSPSRPIVNLFVTGWIE